MTRDLTDAQFRAKLRQYGFGDVSTLGYVRLPNSTASVSLLNTSLDSYRKMLAYLLREADRERNRQAVQGAV